MSSKIKKAASKPNKKSKLVVNKNISPEIHVGVISKLSNEPVKRLVKVTVIKEYVIE